MFSTEQSPRYRERDTGGTEGAAVDREGGQPMKALPADVQAMIRAERREARRAAAVFARVCAEGRADQLYNASLWLDECVDAWRPAMALVARLPRVAPRLASKVRPCARTLQAIRASLLASATARTL